MLHPAAPAAARAHGHKLLLKVLHVHVISREVGVLLYDTVARVVAGLIQNGGKEEMK